MQMVCVCGRLLASASPMSAHQEPLSGSFSAQPSHSYLWDQVGTGLAFKYWKWIATPFFISFPLDSVL